MRLRYVAVPAMLAAAVWAQNGGRPPVTLAVHLVVPCGSPEAGTPVKSLIGLCLDKKPFLTEADVEAAEVHPGSGGRHLVLLTFHHEAAMRELQVTLKNIGNRVAIVLDGRLLGAPTITSGSRLLYLEGGFSQQQAEDIVGAFNRLLYSARGRKTPAAR